MENEYGPVKVPFPTPKWSEALIVVDSSTMFRLQANKYETPDFNGTMYGVRFGFAITFRKAGSALPDRIRYNSETRYCQGYGFTVVAGDWGLHLDDCAAVYRWGSHAYAPYKTADAVKAAILPLAVRFMVARPELFLLADYRQAARSAVQADAELAALAEQRGKLTADRLAAAADMSRLAADLTRLGHAPVSV